MPVQVLNPAFEMYRRKRGGYAVRFVDDKRDLNLRKTTRQKIRSFAGNLDLTVRFIKATDLDEPFIVINQHKRRHHLRLTLDQRAIMLVNEYASQMISTAPSPILESVAATA